MCTRCAGSFICWCLVCHTPRRPEITHIYTHTSHIHILYIKTMCIYAIIVLDTADPRPTACMQGGRWR